MFVPSGVSNIDWIKYFDTNPADGSVLQVSQFGSFSHGLNLDLTRQDRGRLFLQLIILLI